MISKSIPSFITLLNLSCGLLAILLADPRLGVILILLGAILDVFDGLFARMLNAHSELGKQLDSLADMVTFGVAPAYLYYLYIEGDNSMMSLLGPIFLVAAGALRLARFNIAESESNYFEGLAIPATAIFICGMVWANLHDQLISNIAMSNYLFSTILAVALAMLNVSKIRMFSFKQFVIKKVKIYFGILLIASVLLLIFIPFSALPIIIILYVFLSLLDHYVVISNNIGSQ